MTRESERDAAPGAQSRERYLQRMRTELEALERALDEAQESRAREHPDAGDYVAYQRQVHDLTQRRDALQTLLGECEHTREEAAWAELKVRLDLAWRDLLDDDEKQAHRQAAPRAHRRPGKL